MDVVTTSLEALIQRATNPQNQKPDIAAIEAFCVMLTKEAEGVQIGSKLLASHIQSSTEWEALQALNLLDTCMKRCGPSFHEAIGKFRFLNEMIRLVSPKYFGSRTPEAVRDKVLELLGAWTKEFPRETKIKEAYEMLKKQGVVKEDVAAITNNTNDSKLVKVKNPIFEDEEKSKLLQKLLQSKNPDDLQAANRLIKTMVKEDERRVQQNSRRIMELESVHNNVKLLSEMLNSYNRNETSSEDLELMKELYQACERLKPIVLRLAGEAQDNEEMLNDVIAANDELEQVVEKYATVIILNRSSGPSKSQKSNTSLLDLSSPSELLTSDMKPAVNPQESSVAKQTNTQSDLEALGDIFSSLGNSSQSSSVPDTPLLLPDTAIMQPISVSTNTLGKSESSNPPPTKVDSKAKALEDLNELGETLLKQSLSSSGIKARMNANSKQANNVPINRMTKSDTIFEPIGRVTNNSNIELESSKVDNISVNKATSKVDDNESLLNGDDFLVDISSNNEEINKNTILPSSLENNKNGDIKPPSVTSAKPKVEKEVEIKPLTDLNVNLENIKPGSVPPLTVIEEKNAISVVLHFAKDSPRPDVSVIVVTTMSKNSNALSNYLFQAVVPKRCKCRLQPPSGTKLPAHNPFLPPSAITQIMLIANPLKEPVSLKFMLSYTMDEETVTEMGEVDQLPI